MVYGELHGTVFLQKLQQPVESTSEDFYQEFRRCKLVQGQFFEVFTPAWINSAKSETAVSGFKSTWTWPISPELIPRDVFLPSLTTDRPLPSSVDEFVQQDDET